MAKQTILDLDVRNKTVLVRVDFNVPIKDGEITDDNRIVQALPTINYLLEQQAKVVLFSHLGKVKHKDPEQAQKDIKKNNLEPVAVRLSQYVDCNVTFVSVTRGVELEEAVKNMEPASIVLVQNTRYEKGEEKNDPELAAYWAGLGDVFVSDAFGSVHRAHASTVGIASHLPSAVGFLVEKELKFIGGAVDSPERPFVAILGGAKVSDKIAVIDNLLSKADKILIGGGMAYTFLKAKGYEIGNSLLEEDKIEMAKEFMERGKDKLILPIDQIISNVFSADASDIRPCPSDEIPATHMGLDIGPKTVELFRNELAGAKTVIWNGPMGVFEMAPFAKGTLEICKTLADLPNAITIIGGGDSAAAAIQLGFKDKISHISTGGGASLEFMEGKVLPGIAAIQEKE